MAVTSLASAYGAARRARPGQIATLATAVLVGQLSVGWQNDALDAGRDARAARREKPVVAGAITRTGLTAAALAASALAVPVSFLPGTGFARAHLTALAAAWSYNLGVKATTASVAPYAVAFPLLVQAVAEATPLAGAPPWWLFGGIGLLAAGAHLANASPDIDDDLEVGIRGLPQRLGRHRANQGAAALVSAASLLLAFGDGHPTRAGVGTAVAALATVTTGGLLAGRRGPKIWFPTTMAVAALDVLLLVATGRATLHRRLPAAAPTGVGQPTGHVTSRA